MTSLKTAIFNEVRLKHEESRDRTDKQLSDLIFHNADALRLSFPGFLILKNIFTVYSFKISVPLKVRHYIGMSQMEYPYYITANRMILFSEMDATVVKLHGGVEGFLESCFNVGR